MKNSFIFLLLILVNCWIAENNNRVSIIDSYGKRNLYGLNNGALKLLPLIKEFIDQHQDKKSLYVLCNSSDDIYPFFVWVNKISATQEKASIKKQREFIKQKLESLNNYNQQYAGQLKSMYVHHWNFLYHQLEKYSLKNLSVVKYFVENNIWTLPILNAYFVLSHNFKSAVLCTLFASALWDRMQFYTGQHFHIAEHSRGINYLPDFLHCIIQFCINQWQSNNFAVQDTSPSRFLIEFDTVQEKAPDNIYIFLSRNLYEKVYSIVDATNEPHKKLGRISIKPGSVYTRYAKDSIALITEQNTIGVAPINNSIDDLAIICKHLSAPTKNVKSIQFHPLDDNIIGILYDDTILTWNIRKDELINEFFIGNIDQKINRFCFIDKHSIIFQTSTQIHTAYAATQECKSCDFDYNIQYWNYHTASNTLVIMSRSMVYFYTLKKDNHIFEAIYSCKLPKHSYYTNIAFSDDAASISLYNDDSIMIVNPSLETSHLIKAGNLLRPLERVFYKEHSIRAMGKSGYIDVVIPIFKPDSNIDDVIIFLKAAHQSKIITYNFLMNNDWVKLFIPYAQKYFNDIFDK